jgi:FtsP/CotA-like multicopper oxidase with cupredoxin domain
MATAPFSDGTPHAAQWPIPPGHFFDYELFVPIGMAGTYFYHSHVGFQATSVTGPLIVRFPFEILSSSKGIPLSFCDCESISDLD